MSNNKVPIEDLAYELQLLLGSAEVVKKLEAYDKKQTDDKDKVGNLINYFKDSAYMHARNLYNFFAADTKNDAKVTQYINTYLFDLTTYRQWIDALHDHALHIKTKRGTTSKSNVINGKHLNEMVPDFADDIKKMWQDWIDNTTNSTTRTELEDALKSAEESAESDAEKIMELLQ